MAINKKLKAWVRFDGSGRVIPSSLILQRNKPKVGNWKEIPANECCNYTPTTSSTSTTEAPQLAFRMLFDDIESADLLVGDSSDVNDWNTFMNLPTLGTPFTSVSVIGDEVFLYGGSNIKVKPGLMFDSYASTFFLLSVIDEAGCITSVGGDAFSYCAVLTTVDLPACTIVYGSADSPFLDYGGFGGCLTLSNLNIPLLEIIGDRAFRDCTSLLNVDFPLVTSVGLVAFLSCPSINSVNLPLCTNIGNQCFQNSYLLTLINLPSCVNLGTTTELNYVFNGVIGNTITATFNNVLQTNNSGNPDGDIQELVANNTVTITYV